MNDTPVYYKEGDLTVSNLSIISGAISVPLESIDKLEIKRRKILTTMWILAPLMWLLAAFLSYVEHGPSSTIEYLIGGIILLVIIPGTIAAICLGFFSVFISHGSKKTKIASGTGPQMRRLKEAITVAMSEK